MYRWHEDGAIEVQGQGFITNIKHESSIRNYWSRYGPLFVRYAQQFDLPVSWVVGIVYVESGGDEWACSPCEPPFCGLSNCGGGVAKDGKHYVCCAYGLMQIIESNAKSYGGLEHGAQLLGNPEDSVRIGVKIYAENLHISKGDPLVAVRRYNGCSVCSGEWMKKCSESCMFGVGGQANYAEKFARAVNTFLAMDLEPVGPAPPGWEPADVSERASLGTFSVIVGLGAAAFAVWAMTRKG